MVVVLEERVPIEQVTDLIQVGVPLPFKVLDAQARLLLNEGQQIVSDRQHALLVERGAWVDRRLVEVHRRLRGQAAAIEAPRRIFSLFDRWERLVWDLDGVMRRCADSRPCTTEWARLLDEFIATVDRDPDIALFVAVRQDDRRMARYPLTHALHTAVLVLVTGRALGWTAPVQRSLVGAALSMNVAMLELQALMAEQDEPVRPRQLEQIRAHPMAGVKLLQAGGITDPLWLEAVAEHHEQPDGRGYPRGIHRTRDETTLLRMADVYMAKLAPRAFRAPMLPVQASGQLFQQSQASPLALALISAIGVHPPGALVRLKSGEVGVVKRRALAGSTTRVCTLSDARGAPHPDAHERDTGQAAFAIAGPCEEPARFGRVLGERVYGVVPG